MRLILLTFALVAAAAAIPQHEKKAANVDVLTKQRDVFLLLEQLGEPIRDEHLRKLGSEYKIEHNLNKYNEENTVKYLLRLVDTGRIQRKGLSFTTSRPGLREEVALLTRTLLSAKDYETFLKTACWARLIFNEDQFYKAFIATCLQRDDTKGVIFPPAYEALPHYYFDMRVLKKAQDLRIKGIGKKNFENELIIPSNYTAWLPMGEDRLSYFTQDIGLASYNFFWSLGGWFKPQGGIQSEEGDSNKDYVCDNCQTGRGAMLYYTHQQLLGYYQLNRMSVGLPPVGDVGLIRSHDPFKSHLAFRNGLEIPGRDYETNMMLNKESLVKQVLRTEMRMKDAIDKGYVTSTQGSLLSLYNEKGLDMLGTLIEGTGKSINPRFYGSLEAVLRELLGGAPSTKNFWDALPSTLEIQHTMTRDPVFYKLWHRILRIITRWQNMLPSYNQKDLIFPGVSIESLKFSKLITYCEEFLADIDAATVLPEGEEARKNFQMKTNVDRLNHKPFNYELTIKSEKPITDAIVRIFLGPKCDFNNEYRNDRDKRNLFVELDQFALNLKEGKNIIVRNSIDAPMRSLDHTTQKEIFRKIEGALNSHEPFYPHEVTQCFGFPERLALPKGRRDGLDLQVFAIISPFEKLTKSYGPIVPPKSQTYQDFEFPEFVSEYRQETSGDREGFRDSAEDMSGEDTISGGQTRRESGERLEEDRTQTHRGSKYDRQYDQKRRTSNTDTNEQATLQLREKNIELLKNYYKNKPLSEIFGGAVSLDGKPLGFPLERRLSLGCFDIPNVKLVDVKIFSEGNEKCGGFADY